MFVSSEKLYQFGGSSDLMFVEERHRHRYEINPKFVEKIEENGMMFVGHSTDDQRMEIMELKGVFNVDVKTVGLSLTRVCAEVDI